MLAETSKDYQFERGKFTEDQLELAIIELLKQQGYEYECGESMYRRFEDVLMEQDVEDFIRRRYADVSLSDFEVRAIVNELKYVPSEPLRQGNSKAFWLVNEGFDLIREDSSQPAVHIEFIDFEHPEKNLFKVVNQYSVKDRATRRPDLLAFVNGIPVAICEFKTAIEEDKTVYDAWEQITIRYSRDIPSLLKYCFLSVISDGANTRMGSVFTPYKYYYAWNKVNDEDTVANGISSLFSMVAGAFAKDRLIAILRDFVFYPDDDVTPPYVCRYPQFFAAQKMQKNICAHMKPEGDGKGGTYFGATGCGKTVTMLYLSRLLALHERDRLHNPTMLILVDRDDLDSQTSGLFVNATRFLHEKDVRSIETRSDLHDTLHERESGGVYVTTIQKFSEGTGKLSDRCNVICISDEAHRTQTGVGIKRKVTKKGVEEKKGFAQHLRDSFPNATYCGFTGTPIDETLVVFGDVVDKYTMQESVDDGITVDITYEPRLARVIISEEQVREIQKYYDRCTEEGSTPEQVEQSQKDMSTLSVILRNPDRIRKLARDLIEHYEALCSQKPNVVQKAMVVCPTRPHAYDLYNAMLELRPDWGIARKTQDETALSQEQLDELAEVPFINLVATRDKDDEKDLYELCGSKEHRKMLDRQFKNEVSNFRIAIVVDMWITGFDVPCLAAMYVDKPLKKHTLIQTISRVNRVFEGKDEGLVVDYIGIREDMMNALKSYGRNGGDVLKELQITLGIFRNHLALLDEIMADFDARRYYAGEPLERLCCLNDAAEYVQLSREMQTRFMGLAKILKQAYAICFPSGELTPREEAKAQFYMAVRAIVYKQTKGNAPDAETMNSVVEEMVKKAISCTGVESIIQSDKQEDVFSPEFAEELKAVTMPITRFNALVKLLRKAIQDYGRKNKLKAKQFEERLRDVVERYNTRDSLTFASEVVSDFVDDLSDQIIEILGDLQQDKASFERMGISFEEKAFYDILVKVRDDHEFPYEDEKCVALAREIKALVDDKARYADWSTREDVKAQLSMDLALLLYQNGYPPQWNDVVFEKVLEQAENFKGAERYDYYIMNA